MVDNNAKRQNSESITLKTNTTKKAVKKLPVSPRSKDVPKKQSFESLIKEINLEKIIREILLKELTQLGLYGLQSKPANQIQSTANTLKEDSIDFMDIDLIRLENIKDLACINGKINDIDIQVLLDSCANISFMPKDVSNEFGLKIDTSKNYRLRGAPGQNTTIGVVKDVLVTIAPECTIKEDFAIIDNYPYREIGLSRNCLKKYNYDLHESRNHVAISCNNKNFFIPLIIDQNR